jgi:hypothetical protein
MFYFRVWGGGKQESAIFLICFFDFLISMVNGERDA